MALSPQQIQQIAAQQGGGFQLYEMVRSGQATMDEVRSAVGSEAIDGFLARNNLQAPVPTGIASGTSNPATNQSFAPPVTPSQPSAAAPSYSAPEPSPSPAPTPISNPAPAPAPAPQQPMQAPNSGLFNLPATGNAGGYLNPTVPGGTTSNTDYSNYPTPIPTAPNYEEAAQQQGQANLNAAKGTVALSNPNQVTPYGSQTYQLGPDGRPVQTQSLSPDQQKRLDDLNSILPGVTQNIREQTGKNIGDYDFQKIMNLDNLTLPERQTQAGTAGQSAVADALRAREQPRLDQKRKQTESQLLARGFNPGTEGWNEAMDDLSRSENDFNLGLTSISGQEQSRLFGLDTQARDTRRAELNDLFGAQTTNRSNQINEQVLARSLPIQEYQQLVQAMQPGLPQFNQYQGATVEANPIFDATAQKGLFDLGRYGTSVQGELGSRGINTGAGNENKSAGASIAGAAIGAMALMSDIRLKSNITRIGETSKGFPWYAWKWTELGRMLAGDQPEFGVIAQEVAQLDPNAVVIGEDGFMRVDYRRVL